MLQNIIVFVLVLASALASLWWLASARLRLRVLDYLAPRATRGPLARLRAALLARSALGGCGACKSNPSANAQPPTQKAGALRR